VTKIKYNKCQRKKLETKPLFLYIKKITNTYAGKLINEHVILGRTVIKQSVARCRHVPLDLILHPKLHPIGPFHTPPFQCKAGTTISTWWSC
jgi:hypothetical protein